MYTQATHRCTPKKLTGVHLRTSLLLHLTTAVLQRCADRPRITRIYRLPRATSLPQKCRRTESISARKRPHQIRLTVFSENTADFTPFSRRSGKGRNGTGRTDETAGTTPSRQQLWSRPSLLSLLSHDSPKKIFIPLHNSKPPKIHFAVMSLSKIHTLHPTTTPSAAATAAHHLTTRAICRFTL